MECEVENVTVNFGLLKPPFVFLIEQLNNIMYEEENVKKKWHRSGYGRTWHRKIIT